MSGLPRNWIWISSTEVDVPSGYTSDKKAATSQLKSA